MSSPSDSYFDLLHQGSSRDPSYYQTRKSSNMDHMPSAKAVEYIRQPSTATHHFHPAIWGTHDFISDIPSDLKEIEERHQELKKEVKNILSLYADVPSKVLDFVDKIQQLGVGYHFEAEIEDILQQTYNDQNFDENHYENLYYNSLRFRLLRQAGFLVSPDIFNKYRDENGDFHANLVSDVQGMLSLYEATYLSIQGEDILDDALSFTTEHLSSIVTCLSPKLELQVQHALNIPLHRCVERLHARHYISIYEEDESRNDTLFEFAKLDFNIVQLLHRKELTELLGWWEKIVTDIKPKLPFQFRDRMVEGYIVCMGTNFEPQFSLGRIHQTKLWCMHTIFDDAHDVYGNIEELRPLHDAIQRWNAEDQIDLPDHMRVIFNEMMNLYKEIEVDMIRKRHFIGMPYFIKEIKIYANFQFEEATMIFSKDLPTFETWLSFSAITVGMDLFIVDAVMNLGELATKEVFDWIDSKPQILTTYSKIVRILDDIATFKLEQDRGQTISNVTCYMKEYGVSRQEAFRALQNMVKDLWKDFNKDFLRPIPVPRPVLKIILCMVRYITQYYTETEGDTFTESKGKTKQHVLLLLQNSIPY